MERIHQCGTCSLVQAVGWLSPGSVAHCARCGQRIRARKPDSRNRTAALASTALILFVPANVYPIVETDYWGAHVETTILDGVRGLLTGDAVFIGLLVLLTSIVTPALKILSLLFLAVTTGWKRWRRARTWVYRIVLFVDPWNMLEVMLLAIVVAVAELGRIANVDPGAGVFSFGGVVVATILASLTFDPRLVWDPADETAEESDG